MSIKNKCHFNTIKVQNGMFCTMVVVQRQNVNIFVLSTIPLSLYIPVYYIYYIRCTCMSLYNIYPVCHYIHEISLHVCIVHVHICTHVIIHTCMLLH